MGRKDDFGAQKDPASIPAGPLLSNDLKLPLQETSPEQPLCAVPSVGCEEAEMNTTTPTSGAPNLQMLVPVSSAVLREAQRIVGTWSGGPGG